MSAAHHRTEILVIGAGPGGAAAAARFAEAGHDVLMVDRANFPRDKTCGDGLTPRCVAALEKMGTLDAVLDAGATKISGARLVGPYGESIQLDFPEFLDDAPPYGLVLERETLDDLLRQHAINVGARYLGNVKVEDFAMNGDRITVAQASQNGDRLTLQADVVILATGANNRLPRRLGLMQRMPTTVQAVRAYFDGVKDAAPLFDFYFHRYLMPGYGWVFPLGGDKVNAGIGRWPSGLRKPATNNSQPSLPRLLDRFVEGQKESNGNHSQGWQQDGPVKGYPIRTDFPSHRIAGENWVLIGEATGLVAPATGEGIDLAIESGLLAADMLSQGMRKGKWRGRAYQRRLWLAHAPSFSGTRTYARIVINPVMMDYTIWQMSQHRFLAKTTMKLAMGLAPPWHAAHPLFLLQYFLPLPTPF